MLNVMVVDDSTIIRRLLSQELEKMGFNVVVTAKTGKEAVEFYPKYLPDFVTMDITMPILNGTEATKQIKKQYPDSVIIIVTSHGEEKQVMKAIACGAKGYILKPVTAEKIENTISKLFPDFRNNNKKPSSNTVQENAKEDDTNLGDSAIESL